ncbi:aminotransferase family protein [Paenibacillus eucommiae]|uniref:Putrescine aminotransferase n=1 Tax=Paenibacillus eucommiae TaxID=1355755 RepID=A0ABS4J8J4_9BACL|nr:aspartate aminotransferase family protein [Paenibacillus eucommiae]MBP1995396.1 putrescine aminotransferase [Paenibacillus eucommiae]
MSTQDKNAAIEELKQLDRKHYLHPTSSLKQHQKDGPAQIFVEGKGIYLTNINGETFIDGVSTLWNVNVGHGREELAEAAKQQMMKLAYTHSFHTYSHEPVIRLSQKLASMAPGDLNVSFYTSGGSESNDTAFKLVRNYWKLKGQPNRTKIISLERAYHGVTVGATSATGLPTFQAFANALAPDFYQAKPFRTNAELGDKSDPDYEGSIRGTIEKLGSENVAAVIVEPVQGTGGVHIPPAGYLQAVRALCDEFGIFMITDEVICGFGRTGTMFGADNWDFVPDLMCIAKGITSGYIQLGAVMMKESFRDELVEMTSDIFFHGFTYSGHPTACAVALRNIEIIEQEGLVANSLEMGKELEKGLAYLEQTFPFIGKARSIGLMGGFELFKDAASGDKFEPSMRIAHRFAQACLDRKLILRPIVYEGSYVVAIAPPLIITKQENDKMFDIIADAAAAMQKELGLGK